jgi:DNA-directed RNA polymerase subunit RPC12/RpoP
MHLFKKRARTESTGSPQSTGVSSGLPKPGDELPASLKAHSQFIKRVSCSQCGAPKSLPSATAYIYCDFCGALMDYDFRIGNANTNAGLSNTVYHRLIAPLQESMSQARARGDRDALRGFYRRVLSQWMQECPLAVSPRAKNDAAFHERELAYLVESYVTKDLDPRMAPIDAEMEKLAAAFRRIPVPGGAWLAAGDFWPYAELYKKQMILAYDFLHQTGVDAMDPDHPPAGVALRMEYSYFCQAWLPHLPPADGERLIKLYGLDGQYDEVKPQSTERHFCGACGGEMRTLPGARKVICEHCGHSIDINSGDVPCRKCGALVAFPFEADHVVCPFCTTDIRRV